MHTAQHFFAQQQYTQAIVACQTHLQQHPDDITALELMIDCHYYLHQPDAIYPIAQHLLTLNPHNAYAHFALGIADEMTQHYDSALNHFQHAIALNETPQNRLAALFVRQKLCQQPEDYLALLREYDHFLYHNPNYQTALLNRSNVAIELGLYDYAQRDLEIAQTLDQAPFVRERATLNLGLIHLRNGNYSQGWTLFEQRWHTNYSMAKRPQCNIPLWHGEDIGNAPLLAITEQGYGDNIQFVRYAIAAKQCGYNIVTQNQTVLHELLAYNLDRWGIASIPDYPTPTINGVSHYITMMSLPHYLAPHIGSEPIFSEPYLQAQPEYLAKWSKKLPEKCQPRIGIIWSGSAKHARNHQRSISWQDFTQLFSFPAEFHCLQNTINAEDFAASQTFGNVYCWQNDIHSFSDTAALAAHMDLVISVDTSVAHLAAAMGIPTWTLINFNPDFRWQLHRSDTPWYRSMRLFRQDASLSWDSVFDAIRTTLPQQFAMTKAA